MAMVWGAVLVDQLTWYWDAHLWPRLDGLSDDEYRWEPVPGCWSVRLDERGHHVREVVEPEPSPPPVTTIAWRMMHIAVDCFAVRTATFFGGDERPEGAVPVDPGRGPTDLPITARGGLELLDRFYRAWRDAIAGLSDEEMARPLGPRGGPFAAEPMAGLVAHINRETMHHGGEIGVLRDLYRAGYTGR